jgi:hypothetical protein
MRPARRSLLFLVPWLLAAASLSAEPSPDPTLAAFRKRVAHARENLPRIIKAAEAAAERIAAHLKALIDVPYGIQPSFAEEMLNRAGGLAQALPSVERRAQITPDDVTLLSTHGHKFAHSFAAVLDGR